MHAVLCVIILSFCFRWIYEFEGQLRQINFVLRWCKLLRNCYKFIPYNFFLSKKINLYFTIIICDMPMWHYCISNIIPHNIFNTFCTGSNTNNSTMEKVFDQFANTANEGAAATLSKKKVKRALKVIFNDIRKIKKLKYNRCSSKC